jgi:hypothetical protein
MRSLRLGHLISLALCSVWLSQGLLNAQNLTVIGGSRLQQQLTACIEQTADSDLDKLPGGDQWMTIVILDHEKFLQMRDSFHAQRTTLAFSNLASRRMYLSSHVFRDLDNAMRCIPHELGHFLTRSPYEGNAEFAAERIRKRAREICTMPFEPDTARVGSAAIQPYR